MPLNAYAIGAEFDICEGVEFHSWINHFELHNWMLTRASAKVPVIANDNELLIQLDESSLDALETKLAEIFIDATTGLLVARHVVQAAQLDDMTFIRKARQHIAKGWGVYYVVPQ